jgi:hypothetical protein
MKQIITTSILLGLMVAGATASTNFYQKDTTIIIPDGKWVNGELKPYHQLINTFSINNGEEVKTGSVDDTMSIIIINNKKFALRIAKITLPGREILDSGLVELSTLKPVYHRSHQATKTMHFQFSGKLVNGTVETAEKTEAVNMSFDYPLFDSYYETVIARMIHLKDGFIFKFPDFIYEEGGLVWQSGIVTKTTSSSGEETWTISYVDSKSGRKTTYWIDKNRNFLKLQYQFGDRTSIQKPAL